MIDIADREATRAFGVAEQADVDACKRAIIRALKADRRATIRLLEKAGKAWHKLAAEVLDHDTAMEYASRGDHLKTDAVAALQEAWADQ